MANAESNLLYELFAAVHELPESERTGFLDRACGSDEQLRIQLERLITNNDAALEFLKASQSDDALTAATHISHASDDPDGLPEISDSVQSNIKSTRQKIGPYKIREKIGEGGMGEVYIAEQTEPVRRKVALKIIKPGMATKDIIARFEAERQALAMMNHANIAKVLDGGTTPDGRPYFVMELVRGIPITEFCDQKRLTTRQRLELFIKVCQAVQHAHLKGIIHRDLKPSNVLVELHDVEAVPKVIDFGIAKATNQRLVEHSIYTQMSQLIGTPLYMSPEQAELSGLDIDTRSDVYSLGVMLYEILTGTTPFDASTLSSVGVDEMRRIIREEDPPRPSYKLSTLDHARASTFSTRRKTVPRDLSLSMKRELDWIVMKSLEKDRTRRYESASAFAQDIERYLNDEPVQACPPTTTYLFKKYVRRHKHLLTTASVIAAMLIVSTIVSTLFAFQANEARAASEQSEINAKQAQAEAETAGDQAGAERTKAVAAQQASQKNFEAALSAIDKLLEQASSPEFDEISQLQPIRKRMLDDVLHFYEETTAKIGDSRELQHRAAVTRMSLGNLAKQLGDFEIARECFEDAFKQITNLAAESPANLLYRTSQLDALMSIGYFYGEMPFRDMERSYQSFDRVRAEIEKLRQDGMSGRVKDVADLDLARREMNAWHASSFVADLVGDDKKREQFARQGYAVTKTHELTGPDVAVIEGAMAKIEKSENPEAAEGHFQRSIEAMDLVVQQKSSRHDRIMLAKLLGEAARFFKNRNKPVAIDYLKRGIELAEHNYADFPSIDIYGSLMWQLIGQLAEIDHSAIDEQVRETYQRYDQYLVPIPRTEWHFKNRLTAQFRLQNYAQVLADLKTAAAQNREWRNLIVWISPSEVAGCSSESFQNDIFKLANDFVDADPRSVEAKSNRASILLALNQVEQAIGDLKLVTAHEDATFSDHYHLALAALSQDDSITYEQTCEKMIKAYTDSEDPLETHFATWTCALASDSTDDYELVITLAQHAIEREPKNRQYLNGLGAILMRAGQYDAAKNQLEKALTANDSERTSPGYMNYFLAMTEHHLGNSDAAKMTLKKANQLAQTELQGKPRWNRKLTLKLLREEAEQLINGR